ncbi:phosphatase PAP2 family protein [Kolteria novifilia]|uniref:phosphatase PAP2 family protein n=1 Tax=Kolteria novifilia TaxID=2527975 RepID=UPI003AF389A6
MKSQRRRLVIMASGIVLILLASLADRLLFDWVTQPIESGQTKAVIRAMRCWGEGATIVFLSIAIIWVRPGLAPRMGAVLLLTLLSAGVVDLVKPVFGRMRPSEAPTTATTSWVRGSSWNSSFPSGHTATAFAYARGLTFVFPTVKPIVLIAASGTALSRMYDQRHYFSDCVAGALLGWFFTEWGWLALAKLRRMATRFIVPPAPQPAVATT